MIASAFFSVLSVTSVLKNTFSPTQLDPFALTNVKRARISNFAFRISLFAPRFTAEKA
jgi:hypothetical protein